ncbi:HVO_2922 family protein [Halarchaeum sp. P4]|uniref:HVO_2922 family protein n=1 Tax=Halarchaeum sp. P4 TaxID=3421639 RepID=UPI003EB76A35
MSREHDYESELTTTRDDIAAILSGVADGILSGSIRLGDGADAVVVETPDEITLEIELETEDDEVSLELELEWPHTEGDEPAVIDTENLSDENGDTSVPVGAADASQMLARFELFRDRGDEWRWRLRHRNGNIIATSGEGYTRKHNAQKGLRSVMQNAPEAEIIEDSE